MSSLLPEEFPILLPGPLLEYFESYSFDPMVLAKRADEVELRAENGAWLVAGPEQADHFLIGLWELHQRFSEAEDLGLRTYAMLVGVQVDLSREYLDRGWREGLYVPWSTKRELSYYAYKTHLSRLRRNELEPFRLELEAPACKGYIKQAGSWAEDEEITCGSCKRLMIKSPGTYKMA